jgi:hypothetical protein
MSTSYIGYKAIDKGYVDWASAAKDLNATLEANRKEKQTKRKELEDATRETVNKLGDYQAGRSQTANNIFYDFADNSKTAIFELNKQLKSGNLSYNDYKKAYQNLQDGTAEIKKNLETWNAEYETILKGQESINGKPPEDSAITLYMAENHGSLLDIQNSMFYTDPVNLRVYHAKAGENGVPVAGSLRDVLTINNKQNSRVKRVDIQSRLDEFTPEIAKYEFIGTTTGRKILDPTVRKGFDAFRTDTINSIASNDRAMASILVDSSSKEYKLASDISEIPEGAREDYILLGYDGNSIIQPQLTEKQREFAKQTVGNAFDVRVERGVTETAESRARGAGRQKDITNIKAIGELYYGDKGEVASALQVVQAIKSDVTSVERTETDVVVTDSDGNIVRIPFRDNEGNLIPQQEWIKGAAAQLADITNVNEAIKNAGLDVTRGFAQKSIGEFGIETPPKKVTRGEVATIINPVLEENPIGRLGLTGRGDRANALESRLDTTFKTIFPGVDVKIEKSGTANQVVSLSFGDIKETFNVKQQNADITNVISTFIEKLYGAQEEERKKPTTTAAPGNSIFD